MSYQGKVSRVVCHCSLCAVLHGILNFRFTPSLTGLIYHGTKEVRTELRRKHMSKTAGPDFPIIITSYEMAMSDARFLANYKWKYVVVDEVME